MDITSQKQVVKQLLADGLLQIANEHDIYIGHRRERGGLTGLLGACDPHEFLEAVDTLLDEHSPKIEHVLEELLDAVDQATDEGTTLPFAGAALRLDEAFTTANDVRQLRTRENAQRPSDGLLFESLKSTAYRRLYYAALEFVAS